MVQELYSDRQMLVERVQQAHFETLANVTA